MGKKVTIINGSLRVDGNTDVLLKELLKGTKKDDINVKQFVLRDRIIEGCKGCYYCYKHDNCATKDDMQEIHQELQNSDLLIFASPMYWWGVTGLMKTFVDRLYLYYPKRNAGLIAGKKLIILMPMNVNPTEHGEKTFKSEIEPLIMTSKYIFKRLGIKIVNMIFFEGLNAKSDATKNIEYLNKAFKLGERLVHL